MNEVKDKLRDVIDQFKNAEKYKAWNIKPIKGILLYGPSGTGKSYISEAFANEIDAKFFPLSSADIISKYLGESGKSIRAKFEEARKHKLSIIYIDEVDSIAAKRDGSENNKERNATLNELLVQMASPENDNVIMIFATNMLDLLDPAFLRSGRCDFKIEVSLPDFDCRKGILEINSKGRPMAEDVDFEKIARNMSGMNCADMAVVTNEAARKALKAGKDVIEAEDFDKAFEEMICGAKSETKRLGEKEKDTVAIHETGHLFANEIYKVNKTKKISILPRGTTLGFVMHANEEEDDKFLQSKSELMNRIKVALAGRAAEEVFFGDVTTGAANDLEKANGIVEAMICNYALVEELGLSTFDMKNPMVIGLIQEYKNKILNQCYNEVITMVVNNKDKMREFADVLKDKEEMTGDEINEILYPETADAE
jgi:cell division protease FtsH